VHPLDFLKRRLTTGLAVDASEKEVRRGEEVDALVTISNLRDLRDVEVGLVCTEYYQGMSTSIGTPGDSSYVTHETHDAIAHEAWVPVDAALGVQRIPFTIPRDAPFSYHGEVALSFKWELVTRGRRGRASTRGRYARSRSSRERSFSG
jgi:hypothetical protein